MNEARTEEKQFYRVELTATGQPKCQCESCQMWTITYIDSGEPTEIGTSWGGACGKETAEDICDLMNMAFDAGKEAAKRQEAEARKERLAERWS